MSDNNEFVDPLENIINKTREAYGIPNDTPMPKISKPESPIVYSDQIDHSYEEDEYGENDLRKQIEEEEAMEASKAQVERDAKLEEMHQNEKKKVVMPPQSLDPNFIHDAVDFQSNHLATVTGMVEQVKAKYHLHGGIPNDKLRHIQGDLMGIYYETGNQITPQFEQIILNNWEHIDPETGQAYPIPDAQNIGNQNAQQNSANASIQDKPAEINITVQPDTDVTVNIDKEVVGELTHANVVNVHVREVSEEEMRAIHVIENPMDTDIIHPYEPKMNYTPITLPLSGYRCCIKPVSWFETIDFVAPSSQSKVDFYMQRWSIIYNHMTNISIGPFKNFEDFLKNTKFMDLQILEWAILVATADEEEGLRITCGNPKCKTTHTVYYTPRTIIHLNENRISKKYKEIGTVAPGEPAIRLFNEINKKRTRYQLPESKLIVEINEPSAYDYLIYILPKMIELYQAKRPDDPNMEHFNDEELVNDPTMYAFSNKMACMMRISSISVPDPDDPNREYRFTNWEDIEQQIDMIKIMTDQMLLIKLVVNARDMASPVDFYLSNITCPTCGRKDERIPVMDISQNLLFRLTRRLDNMELNLIKLD